MAIENEASSPSRLSAMVRGRLEGWGVFPGDTVYVAFSGGADSMALLAAVCEAGYAANALHCNFHLRGEESDRDENFCRSMARRLEVPIRIKHFDVQARMDATGESVEMAARELRYAWFGEVCLSAGFPLLTAHHASDNVETFFLNLLRGSGLRGLSGIPPRRGQVMRPLIDATKKQITDYLEARGLSYVTDSTNLQPDYKRNRLRLHTLPSLCVEFPGAIEAVERTMANLRRDYSLLSAYIGELKKRHVDARGVISIEGLADDPLGAEKLYHILDGRLSLATVERILSGCDASGKEFQGSGNARYLLDRHTLVPLAGVDAATCHTPSQPPSITAEVLPASSFQPSRNPMEIWLDGAVLDNRNHWQLRPWQHADRIAPFGMRGTKAVSDIISDAKVPLCAKSRVWVLVCDGEPVWVVGFRASRRFAVTEQSVRVVRLRASFPDCK